MVAHVRQPLVDGIGDLVGARHPLVQDHQDARPHRVGQRLCDPRIHQVERWGEPSSDLSGKVTVAGSDTSAAYDAFAPYYDAFTAESDYEAWGRETLAHARLSGLRGDRLLDLACGTGMSFMPFLAPRVPASRPATSSTAMLARGGPPRSRRAAGARRHPRALPDLAGSTSSPASTTRSTTCSHDDELEAAFEGMERSLRARRGGDLRPELAVRVPDHVRRGQRCTEDGDPRVRLARMLARPDAPPGCEAVAELDVFEPGGRGRGSGRARGRAPTGSATSPASAWPALLARAGLECVSVRGVLPDCLARRAGRRGPSTQRSSTPPGHHERR